MKQDKNNSREKETEVPVPSTTKRTIKRLVACMIFLVIFFQVFAGVTYLFRNDSISRNHILGMAEERLDMVYVGGSAAFAYWQPLKAYRDHGFTSYSYATNGVLAEAMKPYLQEVQKAQDPELYLVDLRPFQYWSEEAEELAIRNSSDSLPLLSLSRYEIVSDYLNNRTLPVGADPLSYYVDIMKYHTRSDALASQKAWEMSDNSYTAINKGWEWSSIYEYLDPPEPFHTEERGTLREPARELLVELLDYCKEEELKVLFVVCPYAITQEHYAMYNTMKDMVEGYGFDYLNANDHLDEIGIDFSSDFYNRNHVNVLGAEKFTDYLGAYLSENYSLPNHSDDPAYEDWNTEAQRFLSELTISRAKLQGMVAQVKDGLTVVEQMTATTELAEWSILAEDDQFTLLMIQKGMPEAPNSRAARMLLERWGFTAERGIRMIVEGELKEFDEGDSVIEELGPWDESIGEIAYTEDGVSIVVDGTEYALNRDGINIVVFDNRYRRVVDTVVLTTVDGEMIIER